MLLEKEANKFQAERMAEEIYVWTPMICPGKANASHLVRVQIT